MYQWDGWMKQEAAAPSKQDVEALKQAQLDEDIKERDEFVQRMLEKEDQKTKKLGGVSRSVLCPCQAFFS